MQKIKGYHLAPILALTVFVLSSLAGLVSVDGGSPTGAFLSGLIVEIVVFFLPAVFYLRLRGTDFLPKLRLRLFRPNALVLILLASLLLFLISATFRLTAIYISGADYTPIAETGSLNFTSVLYVLVLFCAVPAIFEEFIFRGVLLAEYGVYGAFPAAVLSALLFSMMHFSFTDFLSCLFSGIVLAAVTYLTRSVFAAMIVHFVNNVFVIFFEGMLWGMIRQPDNVVLFLFLTVSLLLFFLFLFLNTAEYIVYRYAYTDAEDTAKKKASPAPARRAQLSALIASLISPAFVASVIYFIIAAAITALRAG